MPKELMIIFAVVFGLFCLQAVGGFFQIKDLQKALKRMHGKGNIGAGQKRGRFFNGNLVIIACDNEGIITAAEVMDGNTLLARFHPISEVWGKPLVGTHLSAFMEIIKDYDKKKRKKFRGFVNAFEALDMRLYPEHYTQEQLDKVIEAQMKNRYYRGARNTNTKVNANAKGSFARAAQYVNPDTEEGQSGE